MMLFNHTGKWRKCSTDGGFQAVTIIPEYFWHYFRTEFFLVCQSFNSLRSHLHYLGISFQLNKNGWIIRVTRQNSSVIALKRSTTNSSPIKNFSKHQQNNKLCYIVVKYVRFVIVIVQQIKCTYGSVCSRGKVENQVHIRCWKLMRILQNFHTHTANKTCYCQYSRFSSATELLSAINAD